MRTHVAVLAAVLTVGCVDYRSFVKRMYETTDKSREKMPAAAKAILRQSCPIGPDESADRASFRRCSDAVTAAHQVFLVRIALGELPESMSVVEAAREVERMGEDVADLYAKTWSEDIRYDISKKASDPEYSFEEGLGIVSKMVSAFQVDDLLAERVRMTGTLVPEDRQPALKGLAVEMASVVDLGLHPKGSFRSYRESVAAAVEAFRKARIAAQLEER